MDMIGIVLGIFGIVLTILTGWFLQKPLQRAWGSARRFGIVMWTKIAGLPGEIGYARAMRAGNLADSPQDFDMLNWRHEIMVDADGNGRASVDCTFVNTQDNAATEIKFPLWVDYCEHCHASRADSVTDCWSQIGRASSQSLPLEPWRSDERVGYLRIAFPAPLRANEHLRIRWGYSVSHLYSHPGENWFDWYPRRRYSKFSVALTFHETWRPYNVRCIPSLEAENVPPPQIRGNQVYFSVMGAKPGRRYRILFQLSQRQT
jgi:hypothetical protein